MKKIFKSAIIGVGGITGVVAPLATVISCNGTNNTVKHYKLLSTYTGQADQLIALGIKGDYYPYQLDKSAPFDYLTNAGKYISGNHADKTFKDKFAAKVKSLIPDNQGTSWWNQQALEDGEKGSNPEYWTHIGGDLVLYEHYLLDDGAKTINNATAPKHTNSPSTFIQTNFRQSRDPYTRMTKAIIEGLLDQDVYDGKTQVDGKTITADEKKFIGQMLDAARQAEKVDATKKAVDGKTLPTGVLNDSFEFKDDQVGSWLYNDYNFAKNYHVNFIDDDTFTNSEFKDLVNDANKNWIFDKDPAKNAQLAQLFYESTYQDEEATLKGIMTTGNSNPQNNANPSPALAHHPIYDQQTALGSAPMFEGAQRDNSLYLYDLASKLYKASTNKLNDAEGFQKLQDAFANNDQWQGMTKALDNANQIEKDLKARQVKIAALVQKITHKNNGKAPVFGVATVAPGGQGVSTVQSSSKYSFLYRELGFAQPMPNDFTKIKPANGGDKQTGNTIYNMDDNGWWWNISQQDASGESTGIDSDRTKLFSKQFDYGVLAINEQDWSGKDKGSLKDNDKNALNVLFKTGSSEDHKVDYNLWNEGLKTPFVMHMLLDEIVDQIAIDAKDSGATQDEIDAAYDWGTYFTTTYLA